MHEMPQLATATVVVVFSAILLISGQLFGEYRSTKNLATPVAAQLLAGGSIECEDAAYLAP